MLLVGSKVFLIFLIIAFEPLVADGTDIKIRKVVTQFYTSGSKIEHVSEKVELSYLNNLKRAKFLNIYNSRTENLKELKMGEP